ncbi:hypothetical protein OH76DRAFT_1112135 [Lentinus brumalis]|uniref:Uncharacterized protein n=1 Tax=Lentinus brumalis TaxID=2498619 RepID=A0A371CVE4_9APHY|nr:hypothetical protein OH76DRAFT_1112135 [Polyporus brumalis]
MLTIVYTGRLCSGNHECRRPDASCPGSTTISSLLVCLLFVAPVSARSAAVSRLAQPSHRNLITHVTNASLEWKLEDTT